MHGHHKHRAMLRGRSTPVCHNAGDVMKLQIQKDLRPSLIERLEDCRTVARKEPHPHLVAHHALTQQIHQRNGLLDRIEVQRRHHTLTHQPLGSRCHLAHPSPRASLKALRTREVTCSTMSVRATISSFASVRSFSSASPLSTPRPPSVTRTGIPIRSASLNLLPARRSRSSRITSTPAAFSSL